MASYGLTFKGTHSSTFGLTMRTVNRPILPLARDQYIDIPGRDGSILFPEALSDRMMEIEFSFVEKNIPDIRTKVHQIANWLHSTEREPLVFDDEQEYLYRAKVANQLDLEPIVRAGRFSVIFRCLPFAEVNPNEFDEVNEYDTELYYPNPTGFTWEYTTHTSGLYNYGQSTWLKITIVDAVTDPSITNDNTLETLVLPSLSLGQTMLIDGENLDVLIDGISVLGQVSGDFITLQAGDNGLKFNGTSPNATVTFDWVQQVL